MDLRIFVFDEFVILEKIAEAIFNYGISHCAGNIRVGIIRPSPGGFCTVWIFAIGIPAAEASRVKMDQIR